MVHHHFPILTPDSYPLYKEKFSSVLPDTFQSYKQLPFQESVNLEITVALLLDDLEQTTLHGKRIRFYITFSLFFKSFVFITLMFRGQYAGQVRTSTFNAAAFSVGSRQA